MAANVVLRSIGEMPVLLGIFYLAIMEKSAKLKSINPYDLSLIKEYESTSDSELESMIQKADSSFREWKKSSLEKRSGFMRRMAQILQEKKQQCAEAITLEMGKPISEAGAEVEKCAWVCEYYADHAAEFLSPKSIETDAQKSFVQFDPLGVIYGIMPWNFPYWQVFRFAVPAIMAGNTALLKHSPNVSQCALDIHSLFVKAGFPEGIFQTVLLENERASKVIEHPLVRGVSLTGSERAGMAVAKTAGGEIKPSLLELGGSNAVIVLKDADLDLAVQTAFNARFLNTGQSCIAGKRFLIAKEIYEAFVGKFRLKVEKLNAGNPMDKSCNVGPLARVDLAENIERQVNSSVEMGAELVVGGKREGAFYEPTILKGMTEEMPCFKEELFGPVAPFMPIEGLDQAIQLSNNSSFGLGVTICTRDVDAVLSRVSEFEEGAVFINELVKSDPRLPFGGIKNSGFGRELSEEGIKSFVNVKTVYVK